MKNQKGFTQHHFYPSMVKTLFNMKSHGAGKEKLQTSHKSGAGFTIIELVTVVAIIGILAALVATNVLSFTQKSKKAFVLGELKQLRVLATDYFNNNGTYQGFCDPANNAKIGTIDTMIKKIMKDPNPNSPQNYLRCQDNAGLFSAAIYSPLANLCNLDGDKWGTKIELSFSPSPYSACIDSTGRISTSDQGFGLGTFVSNSCSCN